MIVGDLVAKYSTVVDDSGIKKIVDGFKASAAEEQKFMQVAAQVTDSLAKQGVAFKNTGDQAAFMKGMVEELRKGQSVMAKQVEAEAAGMREAMASWAEQARKAAEAQKAALPDIAARSFAILNGQVEQAHRNHRLLHAALLPLAVSIHQITDLYKEQSPALVAVVSTVDHLVISFGSAILATGSLHAAVALFSGPIGVLTGLLLAAGGALVFYAAKQKEAKEATERNHKEVEEFAKEINKISKETSMFGAETESQKALVRHQQELDRIRAGIRSRMPAEPVGMEGTGFEQLRAMEKVKPEDVAQRKALNMELETTVELENKRFAAETSQIIRKETESLKSQTDALLAQKMTVEGVGKAWTEDFLLGQQLVAKHGQEGAKIFEMQRRRIFELNDAIEEYEKKTKALIQTLEIQDKQQQDPSKNFLEGAKIKIEIARLSMQPLALELSKIEERFNGIAVAALKAAQNSNEVFDFQAINNAREAAKAEAILADTVKRIKEQAPTSRPSGTIEQTKAYEQMSDSITSGMQSTIQGAAEGTQTIGDAFRKMGQNIAFSLAQIVIQLGILNPLKNALFEGQAGFTPGMTLGGLFGGGGAQQLAGPAEEGIFSSMWSWLGGLSAQEGGMVPGRRGAPRMVMAHAGEKIIPLSQADKNGGGGATQVIVNGDIVPVSLP